MTTENGIVPIYLDKAGGESAGNELYRALSTIDPENMSGNLYLPNPLNPKQIDFVDLDNETEVDEVGLLDPWDQAFIVFMGLNPKKYYKFREKSTNVEICAVSNTTAFAISLGQDMEAGHDDIMTAGVCYEKF